MKPGRIAWSPTNTCKLPFQFTSPLAERSFDIRAQRKQSVYVHILESGSNHSILLKHGIQPVTLIHANRATSHPDGARAARQRN